MHIYCTCTCTQDKKNALGCISHVHWRELFHMLPPLISPATGLYVLQLIYTCCKDTLKLSHIIVLSIVLNHKSSTIEQPKIHVLFQILLFTTIINTVPTKEEIKKQISCRKYGSYIFCSHNMQETFSHISLLRTLACKWLLEARIQSRTQEQSFTVTLIIQEGAGRVPTYSA